MVLRWRIQGLELTAVAARMTAAQFAGMKASARRDRALGLRDGLAGPGAVSSPVFRPGQLRPQTRILGARSGDLGPQMRHLVLPGVVVRTRLPRGMREQQIAVHLSDRNDLVGEGIPPQHLADLLFDLLAIELDVLLRLRERPDRPLRCRAAHRATASSPRTSGRRRSALAAPSPPKPQPVGRAGRVVATLAIRNLSRRTT